MGKKVGNLGWYQLATSLSKKVGGPQYLASMLVGLGVAIGHGSTRLYDYIQKKITEVKNSETYLFNEDTKVLDNLDVKAGTEFKVLDRDKDAVLVYIDGIENNPYFISYALLKDKTNYK